jgi:hypothetical protein
MDVLTLLRRTRDDSRTPDSTALAAGRAALLGHITDDGSTYSSTVGAATRPWRPRLSWTAAGLATAATGAIVAGSVTLSTQTAYASDVLHAASSQAMNYADLVAGSGQYLRSITHARWGICDETGCEPNDQILDVYMPADPDTEWVLHRDWGDMSGVLTGQSVETTRALDGRFYDGSSWVDVDYADIPLDGDDAYTWIDAQYNGGSASRDEDNFDRIAGILRSGLVPAPRRAALLDALSRVSGVTAVDNVANLDGVTGVAIGRNELLRAGQRQEVIIDPDTGLVIGERTLSGVTVFGWGLNNESALTAIETTVVDSAP